MPAPSSRTLQRDAVAGPRRASMRTVVAGRRIFGGVVEQVEQHLLEQHRSRPSTTAGRRARSTVDRAGQDAAPRAAARCRRSRRHRQARVGHDGAGLRAASCRAGWRRSGSAARPRRAMVPSSSALVVRRQRVGEVAQSSWPSRGSRRAACCRSCEIEVSSAERRRSVSAARLRAARCRRRGTRSMATAAWSASASSRRRCVGRQQRARLVAVEADDADRAAPGAQRQEQPLGARQGVGAAPGRAVVLPGPFGGGEVGVVELVSGG